MATEMLPAHMVGLLYRSRTELDSLYVQKWTLHVKRLLATHRTRKVRLSASASLHVSPKEVQILHHGAHATWIVSCPHTAAVEPCVRLALMIARSLRRPHLLLCGGAS